MIYNSKYRTILTLFTSLFIVLSYGVCQYIIMCLNQFEGSKYSFGKIGYIRDYVNHALKLYKNSQNY
jgi:hypothetical protein